MARTKASTSKALLEAADKHRKHHMKAILSAVTLTGLATIHQARPHFLKTRMYDGDQTGEDWIQGLLSGHPIRFYDAMGMSQPVFKRLRRELQIHASLKPTKFLSMDEQLAIFLKFCHDGSSTRTVREQFQRGPDTISKVFHRLLNMITSKRFYSRYVKLPPANVTPPEIASNPKLYPFFKDVLGAIDGTHIDAFVPDEDIARFRNRKGTITQNCLIACTMDLRVAFALTGWEGSAADSRILQDARARGFVIPPGKVYLGDAGFPIRDTILVPYRGVRYHLKEWGSVGQRPKTPQELFNLRHAQARNIVERIFGVIKRRFKIVGSTPEYPIKTQARIVHAVCCLHNFIVCHNPNDGMLQDRTEVERIGLQQGDENAAEGHVTTQESTRASAYRDKIATEMWEQYLETAANRAAY